VGRSEIANNSAEMFFVEEVALSPQGQMIIHLGWTDIEAKQVGMSPLQQVLDHIGSDESAAARYQDLAHMSPHSKWQPCHQALL
jgi:hypothetical protein